MRHKPEYCKLNLVFANESSLTPAGPEGSAPFVLARGVNGVAGESACSLELEVLETLTSCAPALPRMTSATRSIIKQSAVQP